MQNKLFAQAALAIVGAAITGGASASGFQLQEQNASGLGNAYAGSAAVAEDASTVYYNPAGMARLAGINVSGGVNVLKPSYKFRDDGSSDAPAVTGSNSGDAGGVFYLPTLYSTWQLDDKWFAGIGMGSPFGLKTQYDRDWVGRFQSLDFQIKTYNINPSLAYKATDKLSLGFGLDWERMEATFTRDAAVAASYSAYNTQAQSTEITLDVSGQAWGWNTGVLYKLTPKTDLGFSYRSKMFEKLKGDLNSSNQTIAQSTTSSVSMTLPDTYILSVAQQLDERWQLLGDVSRTNWSSVDQVLIMYTSGAKSGSVAQVLDANFRDTWRFAVGGTYKVNDNWKLKSGLAYDQSPVRGSEERLVSLPDNNRYWYTAGAQWKIDKTSTIDLGLAYIHIHKTRIESNESSSASGYVVGAYAGSIVIVGLQYSAHF
jgi:long-chain fatty acid transport protein